MELSVSEAIEEYLLSGLQGGWSKATHRNYGWQLERWRQWLAEKDVSTVEAINKRDLRAWGASLREFWRPATIKQAVVAVRCFLTWCRKEKIIKKKLAKVLTVPSVPRRKQRTLKAAEATALLSQTRELPTAGLDPATAIAVGLRNEAIVSLLYDSLLRAKELCELRIQDVDLEGRQLTIGEAKGGNEESAQFGPETAERLRAWLAVRDDWLDQSADGVDSLFVSLGGRTPGQALTTRGLRIIVKRIGERAGVTGVSPHAFRRGGARELTRQGAPTRVVQDVGRWSTLEQVERYTRDLDAGDLYDRYSPVHHLEGEGRRNGHEAVKPPTEPKPSTGG